MKKYSVKNLNETLDIFFLGVRKNAPGKKAPRKNATEKTASRKITPRK